MDEYIWASAVGRVRVREKDLLSRSQLQQAAEAADLALALGTLRDTPYGPYIAGVSGRDDFVGALERALNGAYDYAMSVAPAQMPLTVFRGRHDFHNLKVLAKVAYGAGSGHEQAFSRTGNFRAEELAQSFEPPVAALGENARSDLKIEMKALHKTYVKALALIALSEGQAPAAVGLQVDSVIDRAYYRWASSVYRKAGHPGLIEFLSAEVDQLNLRIAVRATRLGIVPSLYGRIALPGGTVGAEDLALAYSDGIAAVAAIYRGTHWASLAERGAALCLKKESLTRWERACDDALMAVVRKARYFSLGPEPVFGFIFGKEAEVRNLRVILSGKQSAVSTQEISERLRDPYV
ncbi:MAG: V-type ATPase subunit [Bacillota bacterium]